MRGGESGKETSEMERSLDRDGRDGTRETKCQEII